MSIPAQEAAASLRDIERARRRSAASFHDRRTSPFLILWGVIWVAGYTASYIWPGRGWLAWLALVPAGMVASWRIGSRQAHGEGGARGWRVWASVAATFLFIAGVYVVLPARTNAQGAAVFPLLIALFYTLEGIWHGTFRLGAVGVAVGLLTVGGYVWLQPYFLVWLAGVGGGALILGGTWLRGA